MIVINIFTVFFVSNSLVYVYVSKHLFIFVLFNLFNFCIIVIYMMKNKASMIISRHFLLLFILLLNFSFMNNVIMFIFDSLYRYLVIKIVNTYYFILQVIANSYDRNLIMFTVVHLHLFYFFINAEMLLFCSYIRMTLVLMLCNELAD